MKAPVQKRIGVAALAALAQHAPPPVILDVRTKSEFDAAHVATAQLQPLTSLNVYAANQQFGPSTAIYVMCQSGARARRAIEMFEKEGFDNCVLVEGGMDAWIAAGLPVVRGHATQLSNLRQVQIVIGLVCTLGAGLAIAVDGIFAVLPLLMGLGLIIAGCTGTCGLAVLLAKMPWNNSAQCGGNVCCTHL